MTSLKLIYFPVKGRGESIRTILIDNNTAYEEVTVKTREEWIGEWKTKMPFGQIPCLYDGDFMLTQSCAILRYLGRKFKMYGSDDKEASLIDMLNDHVEEIRGKYVTMIYQNYDAGKEPFIKELPEKLQPLENLITENGYMTSDKMSWADYNLFDLLTILVVLSPSCLDTFPKLKAYHARVLSRPGVQKRQQTDEYKNMPINGNGKQ